MTIDTQSASVSYQGNGSTRSFAVPFRIDDTAHFRVYITDRTKPTDKPRLVASSDYIIEGDFTIADATVTYPRSTTLTALSSQFVITIERVVPLVQDISFLENSAYYLEDMQTVADRITQISQQLNEQLARAVKAPIGSGINPDDLLASVQASVTQAQTYSQIAQSATMPSEIMFPFKNVTVVGSGTTVYNPAQAQNGNVALVTVNATATTINLPKMNTLTTLPYVLIVKRNSGAGTLTVAPASGDTIQGTSSLSIPTNGQTVFFISDSDSLLGNWTYIFAGDVALADGSIATAKIADNAITNAKMADASVGTTELIDSGVTNAKLNNNSVTTAKVADGNITKAKCDTVLAEAINAIPFSGGLVSVSASTTLGVEHKASIISVTTGGASKTITLPVITSVTAPYWVVVRRTSGTDQIKLVAGGSDTINATDVTEFIMSAVVGNSVLVVPDYNSPYRWYTMLWYA
ncbi:tail fiber protein [Caudoviricetes sp.]|nr:tail fiber protein [Caudoviricetes sp.]